MLESDIHESDEYFQNDIERNPKAGTPKREYGVMDAKASKKDLHRTCNYCSSKAVKKDSTGECDERSEELALRLNDVLDEKPTVAE